MFTKESVVPIPPPFNKYNELDIASIKGYLNFLYDERVETVMTTAGTSQFNLLSDREIILFNQIVGDSFAGKNKILGMPPKSLKESIKYLADDINSKIKDSYMMALYPDRFYDYDSVYDYLARLREHTANPLFLHAMFMRDGRGGSWDYEADLICKLYENNIICGIKEEHSNLQKSYDFVKKLPEKLGIIVAGGSMRRYEFLESAGANAFLAGVGSLFPHIEYKYCNDYTLNKYKYLDIESKLFDVFNKHGWHRSLRIGLTCIKMYPEYDRQPWPKRTKEVVDDIERVVTEILNER